MLAAAAICISCALVNRSYTASYVVHEHPAFVSADSAGTVWTLAFVPLGSVECWFNGLSQDSPADYSVAGKKLTSAFWSEKDAPGIWCNYWY